MIKVENTDVWGFEHAIRGCRNPLNSWSKSDSVFSEDYRDFVIGPNDMDLLTRLFKSGPEHRKVLRQIFVSMDITAPLYFFKEFDTYKISTVASSCSTMHTIHKKPFELSDFSAEHILVPEKMETIIKWLNEYRDLYINLNEESLYRNDDGFAIAKKDVWWQLIQLLPSSYNQKRTWTGSYENLINIYHQRKNHKLDEWHQFCDWVETLPYAKDLIIGE